MICNIDEKGRKVRAVSGYACVAIGLGLSMAGIVAHTLRLPLLISGIATSLGGVFQIFESRKGWCVLRAMGVKTRL